MPTHPLRKLVLWTTLIASASGCGQGGTAPSASRPTAAGRYTLSVTAAPDSCAPGAPNPLRLSFGAALPLTLVQAGSQVTGSVDDMFNSIKLSGTVDAAGLSFSLEGENRSPVSATALIGTGTAAIRSDTIAGFVSGNFIYTPRFGEPISCRSAAHTFALNRVN